MLGLDPTRQTPAYKFNDGLDYVPTNRYVLFGHHFAAIAGAGPLAGPVLAAQMGYLPGMMWILAGVVFAGAVQDFIILFVSTRRDGRSIGDLIKSELGDIPGVIALLGTFMIMVIILAVLALIVVKALTGSPWGSFTVIATIPIALHGRVFALFPRGAHRRGVHHRLLLADAGHCRRPVCGGPILCSGQCLRSTVWSSPGCDRLRFCGVRHSGVASADAA